MTDRRTDRGKFECNSLFYRYLWHLKKSEGLVDEFPLGSLSFSVDIGELEGIHPDTVISPHAGDEDSLDQVENEQEDPFTNDVHNLLKPRPDRRVSLGGKWSAEEDNQLKEIVKIHGAKNWKKIASLLGELRTDVQCLHRWNKVLRPGLHKGSWTKDEDAVVYEMVMKYGVGKVKWSSIAAEVRRLL
jgi:hypothetical protein